MSHHSHDRAAPLPLTHTYAPQYIGHARVIFYSLLTISFATDSFTYCAVVYSFLRRSTYQFHSYDSIFEYLYK